MWDPPSMILSLLLAVYGRGKLRGTTPKGCGRYPTGAGWDCCWGLCWYWLGAIKLTGHAVGSEAEIFPKEQNINQMMIWDDFYPKSQLRKLSVLVKVIFLIFKNIFLGLWYLVSSLNLIKEGPWTELLVVGKKKNKKADK